MSWLYLADKQVGLDILCSLLRNCCFSPSMYQFDKLRYTKGLYVIVRTAKVLGVRVVPLRPHRSVLLYRVNEQRRP